MTETDYEIKPIIESFSIFSEKMKSRIQFCNHKSSQQVTMSTICVTTETVLQGLDLKTTEPLEGKSVRISFKTHPFIGQESHMFLF